MPGPATDAAAEITNLLYRYAELMDGGRFEDLHDELFSRARFVVAPPPAEPVDGRTMAEIIIRTTIRHPDGTPRTKHVITNPIVELDPSGTGAECRSYYTVLQQVGDRPLQAIAAGRYRDRFTFTDGRWWFAQRDYTMLDLVGDVSRHLRPFPGRGGGGGGEARP